MKNTQDTARALPLPSLVGGAVTVAAALLTRWAVGSPLATLHKLEALRAMPPLWLMSLLWLASFALPGLALGYLLTCGRDGPHKEALFWRGSTFLVLALVFSLLWYALLFGKFYPVPSCLCLFLAVACSLACWVSWMRVRASAAIAVLGFTVWHAYLILLQLAILLTA